MLAEITQFVKCLGVLNSSELHLVSNAIKGPRVVQGHIQPMICLLEKEGGVNLTNCL